MVLDLLAGWLVGKGLDGLLNPTCDFCETNKAAGSTPCCSQDICNPCLHNSVKTGFFGGSKLQCPFCGTKTKV